MNECSFCLLCQWVHHLLTFFCVTFSVLTMGASCSSLLIVEGTAYKKILFAFDLTFLLKCVRTEPHLTNEEAFLHFGE